MLRPWMCPQSTNQHEYRPHPDTCARTRNKQLLIARATQLPTAALRANMQSGSSFIRLALLIALFFTGDGEAKRARKINYPFGIKPKADRPDVYALTPVKQKPPLCKVMIGNNQVCGGTRRPQCYKYVWDLKKCQDAPFQQACCKPGWSCQRLNEVHWRCLPTLKRPLPPLPSLKQLPPKSHLPPPIFIKSKDKGKHKYMLIKYDTSWAKASAICQYYFGLHLASVHDIGEMWRINNQCYLKMENMCWVGATDREEKGIFKWSDGSSWDFAFWQQNGGVMATKPARCVALQDGFQTWACNEKFSIACQVY